MSIFRSLYQISLVLCVSSILFPQVVLLGAGDDRGEAEVSARWEDHTSPWLGSRGRPGNDKRKKPFKLFDNMYYVGLQWVSAYLIMTSDGLVLLDATYGDTVIRLIK